MPKKKIGVIGAMDSEVGALIALLEEHRTETVGGIIFHTGCIFGREVVIARCGIGKVFAAMCAQTMILTYAPDLLINTGIGGAIGGDLHVGDVVIADRLVQHDMDTSAIGDPIGMVSGINKVFFETDPDVTGFLLQSGRALGFQTKTGTVASGDRFVADRETKTVIRDRFDALVCEMEGAAIAQVAYVNQVPFSAVRVISDNADGSSGMDYFAFLPMASNRAVALTQILLEKYGD